ncbi:sensor histidine kinase [Novipirellula sp. SH528]|uniref:sensor histidine kinase n=1 Tax=Novipirellula sp. SH528 TaxID=3454466 RepID=UPI003FA07D3B
MRLRSRLSFIHAVTGLALLCLGFSGAWHVLQLQKRNSEILSNNVASIRAAEELELIVREMRHELDRYLLTKDREYLLLAIQNQDAANEWINRADGLAGGDDEKALVAVIRSGIDNYFAQLHQLVDDPDSQISSERVEALEEETLSKQVLVASRQYLNLNESELEESSLRSGSMALKLSLAMALLGACGAAVGLVAGYGVARSISRSMYLLSVPIRDVAGKLDTVVGPVEVSADPSLQDLQQVLETVSTRVGSVVEQLQNRHKEVIRADQLAALGKLGAGLAHELRNPLMCMKTLVQSARHNKSNLDADDLAVLDDEITRVDKLLQTFLDFAKPSSLVSKPVDLREIVQQTFALVTSRAEARGIEVTRSMPDDVMTVQGDATQLRQVLLNLILNAFDFIPNSGKVDVTVAADHDLSSETSKKGTSSSWVSLSVADNGCSLPEESERIFEPFFSTKELGLGLGLPISRKIIGDHGGTLKARNRDEGGVIFTARLPVLHSTQQVDR